MTARRNSLRKLDCSRLEFDLTTNTGNAERNEMCTIFKQDVESLGIKVNYRPLEFTTLVDKLDSLTLASSTLRLGELDTLLENMLGRAKETMGQGDLQQANAKLISRAAPPWSPAFPPMGVASGSSRTNWLVVA